MKEHHGGVRSLSNYSEGKHYHIRWSSSALDWEAFCTRDEAEESARTLARPSESYTIEELDGDCPQCAKLFKTHSAE